MRPMTLDYLGAYFDAIGSIHFAHRETASPALRILTYCQDEPTIEAMYNMLPVGLTTTVKTQERHTYRWMIGAREETMLFLQTLEPYVRVKRALVALGVDFLMQQKIVDQLRTDYKGRVELDTEERELMRIATLDLLELRDDITTASVAIRGRKIDLTEHKPLVITWGKQ